tara:strand:- start:13734 stop:13979 length:246 start_codon:yes stop_codon:yes gene_type:complete
LRREVARDVGVLWNYVLSAISMIARAETFFRSGSVYRGRVPLGLRSESWNEDSGSDLVPLTCTFFFVFRRDLSKLTAALAA